MMKVATIHFAVLSLFAGALYSQTDPASKFGYRNHTYQEQTLPYRLFVPENYQVSSRYPLLLALHGAGERGTNNTTQIQTYKMATAWVDESVQSKSPCFVVAPQVPPESYWGDFFSLLDDLLDSLGREFSLDSNRLYVTGLSMGGYGTFDMLMEYPQRFAAAIPMSAGGYLPEVHLIKDIPIWDFHGARDDLVPVSESRSMIQALENLGRTTIYTHCHGFDCGGLPDSILSVSVASHADLFYTEYRDGGHAIWDEAYTTPLLSTWLFDKYRLTPMAIRLNNFSIYRSLVGLETIEWEGGLPDDSVEIWESPDAGGHWQIVARAEPNTGTFNWNTDLVPDRAFGLLKIFLKNNQGFVYGKDQSHYFTIDNAVNGIPFVQVRTPEVQPGETISADSVALQLFSADPEGAPLTIRILYSTDRGSSFALADSVTVPSDTLPITRRVEIGRLANSENALITVESSDGVMTGEASLPAFAKRTVRPPGPAANHTSGGGGTVTVHVVDPPQLTGHLYRVTFQGDSYGEKSYDVTDVDAGKTVVQGGLPLDGSTEGPGFDGVRLVVRDVLKAEVNSAQTKWEVGAPTSMDVRVYLPRINLGGTPITGFPHPADYDVPFSDVVVDTSSSAVLGLPARPVKFSVMNLTEDRRSDFIYVDSDNSGTFTSIDEIHILEPDSASNLRITWALTFVAPPGKTLPQPGDRFALRTIKPITPEDIYEFRTISTSVKDETQPVDTRLFANYPNPFNPKTVIRFSVRPPAGREPVSASGRHEQGTGFSDVKLVVYDLLGREVAVLVNEKRVAGTYEVTFDGTGLASGLYFYRLTAGPFSDTQKALLLK